jgi:hypothetical protein
VLCDSDSLVPRNKKEPDAFASGSFLVLSENGDVGRLWSFGTLLNGEFNFLAFLEIAVTITLNGGEMDEHVRSTFTGEETITLVTIEPLYRTDYSVRHFCLLWQLKKFV